MVQGILRFRIRVWGLGAILIIVNLNSSNIRSSRNDRSNRVQRSVELE